MSEDDTVTVRHLAAGDREEVRLFAAIDGRHPPEGDALVAAVDGRVLAALPLDGGAPLADPFTPTGHLLELLELRAGQLEARRRRRPPRLRRLRRPA